MSDHPLTRRQTVCPFCAQHKDRGLVACWPCFRSSGLKSCDCTAESMLDAFEDVLAERQRAAELRQRCLDAVEMELSRFVSSVTL